MSARRAAAEGRFSTGRRHSRAVVRRARDSAAASRTSWGNAASRLPPAIAPPSVVRPLASLALVLVSSRIGEFLRLPVVPFLTLVDSEQTWLSLLQHHTGPLSVKAAASAVISHAGRIWLRAIQQYFTGGCVLAVSKHVFRASSCLLQLACQFLRKVVNKTRRISTPSYAAPHAVSSGEKCLLGFAPGVEDHTFTVVVADEAQFTEEQPIQVVDHSGCWSGSEIVNQVLVSRQEYALLQQHSSNALPHLPPDVLLKVLAKLDARELAAFSAVSKDCREIADTPALWVRQLLMNDLICSIAEEPDNQVVVRWPPRAPEGSATTYSLRVLWIPRLIGVPPRQCVRAAYGRYLMQARTVAKRERRMRRWQQLHRLRGAASVIRNALLINLIARNSLLVLDTYCHLRRRSFPQRNSLRGLLHATFRAYFSAPFALRSPALLRTGCLGDAWLVGWRPQASSEASSWTPSPPPYHDMPLMEAIIVRIVTVSWRRILLTFCRL
eukprot:jgi/Chlat1/1888/Chrsp145S02205